LLLNAFLRFIQIEIGLQLKSRLAIETTAKIKGFVFSSRMANCVHPSSKGQTLPGPRSGRKRFIRKMKRFAKAKEENFIICKKMFLLEKAE
jgi:hypothetical protein